MIEEKNIPRVEVPIEETLTSAVRNFLEAERTKLYALAAKNLRLLIFGVFSFMVLASSVFFGLCLFILGLMINADASRASIGTLMWILGAVVLLSSLVFLSFALSEGFWIKLFKIDRRVEAIEERGGKFVPKEHIPGHPV